MWRVSLRYAAESRVSIARLEDEIADLATKVKASEERVEKIAKQSTAGAWRTWRTWWRRGAPV